MQGSPNPEYTLQESAVTRVTGPLVMTRIVSSLETLLSNITTAGARSVRPLSE